jgi:DNA-binding response OmpR family regulator
MYQILIVEDDKILAQTLKDCFERKLYHIDLIFDGENGYKYARKEKYDLLVLDWMLPKKTGVDLLKQLRFNHIDTPCLIISTRNNIQDLVTGLKSGSDGYLCKPFNLLEFKTRVNSLLKRPTATRKDILTLGDIELDTNTVQVKVRANPVHLRRKEFLILKYMMLNQGNTMTREQIMNNVWGPNEEPYIGSIDVHLSRIRKAIDIPFGTKYIKTVSGIGYKIDNY